MRKSTIGSIVAAGASLKLTIVAMVSLAIGVLLNYRDFADLDSLITMSLAVLIINLIAALFANPRIRQNTALSLFHVALLGLLGLILVDDEFSLQARVELSEGQKFDPNQVVIVKAGRWYQNSLSQIAFTQGPVSVHYGPGRVRGVTRSEVAVENSGEISNRTVGDDTPLSLAGYKFYTSHNKGFSVLLGWQPRSGEEQKGTVHFPSYPKYEWKQTNTLELSPSRRVELNLVVHTAPPDNIDWVLDNSMSEVQLSIHDEGVRHLLSPGQSMETRMGRLTFYQPKIWMGYRIAHNPILPWMFVVSVLAVLFLGWHFLIKFKTWESITIGELKSIGAHGV